MGREAEKCDLLSAEARVDGWMDTRVNVWGVCFSGFLSPSHRSSLLAAVVRAGARAGIGREPVTDTRAAAEPRYKSGAERRGSEKEEGEERRGAKA